MEDIKKKYTTKKGNIFKYDSGNWTVGGKKILAVHTHEERMAEVIGGYDTQPPLGGRTSKGIFTQSQARRFVDNCHAWTPEGKEGHLCYFTEEKGGYQLRIEEVSKIEKITQ